MTKIFKNVFLLVCITFPACSIASDGRLNSTLWIQNSGEYAAITYQIYQSAKTNLSSALGDKTWTASIEQKDSIDSKNIAKLTPAIAVDIDETILDNSPFGATLIEKNSDFDPILWGKWVVMEKAEPIPGAVEFLNYARSKDIEIFYVTNRSKKLEKHTRNNLKKLGYPIHPVSPGQDIFLTKGEVKIVEGKEETWGSNKTSRRNWIAANYRILLLIGDALGDFVSVEGLTPIQQKQLFSQYKDHWGKKWFVLPNPNYGKWNTGLNPLNTKGLN